MTVPTQAMVATVLGASLSWAILRWMLRSGLAWRIAVDTPNQRSLHESSTPRVGGLAVMGSVVIVAVLLARDMAVVLALAVGLTVVSAIDDRRSLPVGTRLVAHVVGAALAVGLLLPFAGAWKFALLVVVIAWSTDLYNFMDGADGLAGGMALIGFGAFALVAAGSSASPGLVVMAAAIAGSAAGFLAYNFPPARVFLGDAGSVPLGFLAGSLGIVGWSEGVWPAWFPLLVFSPFVVDASVTLARRLLRGEKPWTAHSEHLYQRMVKSGLGHRRTAVIWYGVMLACAVTGGLAISWPISGQIALLGAWAMFYAAAFGSMRWQAPSPPR